MSDHSPIASAPRSRTWARLSLFLCIALAAVVPVSALVALVSDWPQGMERGLQSIGPAAHAFGLLGLGLQVAVVALLLVPALVMSACLLEAARCLASLGGNSALTHGTVKRLRRFSALMLASVAAGLLVPTVAGVVVSLASTGQGALSVGMSSHQAILLVFAGVTWRITHALEGAVAVADEYAQIV